jgi:hypothetical protein
MTDHCLRTCQGCQYHVENLGVRADADDHAEQVTQGRWRAGGDNDGVA